MTQVNPIDGKIAGDFLQFIRLNYSPLAHKVRATSVSSDGTRIKAYLDSPTQIDRLPEFRGMKIDYIQPLRIASETSN